MKIVDRKTFMQMPKGTVFCKIDEEGEYPFDIREAWILDEAFEIDFLYKKLGAMGPLAPERGDYNGIHALSDLYYNPGKEAPFCCYGERDGSFEGDEVRFAIFSRAEVEEMITLLQQALRDGYKGFKCEQYIQEYI